MKKHIARMLVFALVILTIPALFVQSNAQTLTEELFGIEFYKFHYMDENERINEKTIYSWGSKDDKETGFELVKTGATSIRLTINAGVCEEYRKYKPCLIWIHKADGLFDTTRWTDIKKWYENKMSETFLLQQIDYTGDDIVIDIKVPMKLNIGMTGLINGGYYEVEFYDEGSIPEQLKFAYDIQTYSLEDLEAYMKTDMSENISGYYDADSGFRPEKDGFSFANTDFTTSSGGIGNGLCSGITSVTTAKYNGYPLIKEFNFEDKKYQLDSSVEWYDGVFGASSINDIDFPDLNFTMNIPKNYSLTEDVSTAFPLQPFSKLDYDNMLLGGYLAHYKVMNNTTVLLRGKTNIKGLAFSNLDNRWSIIDYVASYLRNGKAVTVNISKSNGGHAVVGYRLESIDEDTFRLWCYDSCYPDDYVLCFKEDAPQNYDVNEDGSYKNIVRHKRDVYIDFTKTTKKMFVNKDTYKEIDVFDFDASHLSCGGNSNNNDMITFSLCKGDSIGVFDYGNESNEVISYKAYPVIKDEKTVELRTFAFYQSGEVREVTNSQYTNVKMDYSYIGLYKIKDSKITLSKDSYKFDDNANSYIEAYVSYDNFKENFGQIKVRIPVTIS